MNGPSLRVSRSDVDQPPTQPIRKRRLFGPLLYSTLVIALICLIYLAGLRLLEWKEREVARVNEVDPKKELAANLVRLNATSSDVRLEGVRALAGLAHRFTGNKEWSTQRMSAVSAISTALIDRTGTVRAAAADALGSLPSPDPTVGGQLAKALKDDDLVVQLAAARALFAIGGESQKLALNALADIVADTTTSSECIESLKTMALAGKAGSIAAVEAFTRRLSHVDELNLTQHITAADLPEPELLLPALEPLLKSDNPPRRTIAAIMAISIWAPPETFLAMGGMAGSAAMGGMAASAPALNRIKLPGRYQFTTTILEQAVVNISLEPELRESALQALNSTGTSRSLRRCGLELAHQLEAVDVDNRLTAAKLLHLIDPTTLSGFNILEETP